MTSGLTVNQKFSWLPAGAAYFGIVFGAGFVLGTVRALWVAPRIGERWAELLELPVMLVVIFATANWVNRTLGSGMDLTRRIATGAFALILMLLCEFGLVLTLRNLTLAEYFRSRDQISGLAYYLSLLVFASLPVFLRHSASVRLSAANREGGFSNG